MIIKWLLLFVGLNELIIFEALKDLVEPHPQLGSKLSKLTMILMTLQLNLPDDVFAHQLRSMRPLFIEIFTRFWMKCIPAHVL